MLIYFLKGTCPGFFQIITLNFLGENSRNRMPLTISFAHPPGYRATQLGPFCFIDHCWQQSLSNWSSAAGCADAGRTASDTVWLAVRPTAPVHIARAVCIPGGHSRCQRQVSRLRPPAALQPTAQ